MSSRPHTPLHPTTTHRYVSWPAIETLIWGPDRAGRKPWCLGPRAHTCACLRWLLIAPPCLSLARLLLASLPHRLPTHCHVPPVKKPWTRTQLSSLSRTPTAHLHSPIERHSSPHLHNLQSTQPPYIIENPWPPSSNTNFLAKPQAEVLSMHGI